MNTGSSMPNTLGKRALGQRPEGDVEVGHAHRHGVVGDGGQAGGGRAVEQAGRPAGVGEGHDDGVGGELGAVGQADPAGGVVVVDADDRRAGR